VLAQQFAAAANMRADVGEERAALAGELAVLERIAVARRGAAPVWGGGGGGGTQKF